MESIDINQNDQNLLPLTYECMKKNIKEYMEHNRDTLVSINIIWHDLSVRHINPLVRLDFIKAIHDLDLEYYYHKKTLYVLLTNKSSWEYNIEKMEILEDKEIYFSEDQFLSLYFNLDLMDVDDYIVNYLVSSNNVKYMRHVLEEYEFEKEEYVNFLNLAKDFPEMKCLLIKYKYKTKVDKVKDKYKSLEKEYKSLDDMYLRLSNSLDKTERIVMTYNYYVRNIFLISALGIIFYMIY
jgi:hypothetical protein